MGFTQLQSEAA